MDFETYASFQDALSQHRQFVNGIFAQVLGNPEETDTQATVYPHNWEESVDDKHVQLREFLNQNRFEADTIIHRLNTIYQSSRYRHLSNTAQTRLQKLMPHLFAAASDTDNATKTLIRLFDFVDTISRRSSYLALLEEKPEALKRLAPTHRGFHAARPPRKANQNH